MSLNVEYVFKVLDRFSGPLDKLNKKVGVASEKMKRLGNSAKKLVPSFQQMAIAATAFATVGIMTAANFQEQMNGVAAVTQATGDQFDKLKKQAKEMGIQTQFSASEAAAGQAFLGMAGFKTDEILKVLPATLNLASAGSLDLASAADIASNIMQGFNADVSQAGRYIDVLAMAASKSNTDVMQLGEGMKYAAPVAAALGVSVEEATAAMGSLSNAGLQSSMAGTGLRKILSTLAKGGKKLTPIIGNMTLESDGFTAMLEEMRKRGITAAQAMDIFGERGGPAVLALVNQVDGMKKLNEQLSQSEGTAKRMADTKMQGLPGALKRLKSAFEGLMISIFDSEAIAAGIDKLADAIRGLATKVEIFKKSWSELTLELEKGNWLHKLSTLGERLHVGVLSMISEDMAQKAALRINRREQPSFDAQKLANEVAKNRRSQGTVNGTVNGEMTINNNGQKLKAPLTGALGGQMAGAM